MRTHDEITVQAEAIKALHPKSEESTLWIIDHFASHWRKVLDEFESKFNRTPNHQELIWCLGVMIGKDPQKAVEAVEQECK